MLASVSQAAKFRHRITRGFFTNVGIPLRGTSTTARRGMSTAGCLEGAWSTRVASRTRGPRGRPSPPRRAPSGRERRPMGSWGLRVASVPAPKSRPQEKPQSRKAIILTPNTSNWTFPEASGNGFSCGLRRFEPRAFEALGQLLLLVRGV